MKLQMIKNLEDATEYDVCRVKMTTELDWDDEEFDRRINALIFSYDKEEKNTKWNYF